MSAWTSLGGLAPRGRAPGSAADLRELGRPVQRDPAHQLRRDVVARLAARLPDPLVGRAPRRHRPGGLRLDDRPQPPRHPLAVLGVDQDRVQHRAVDVVLALVEGAVPDPHRACARVAGELVACALGEVAAAVDPVHDLQRSVFVGLEIGDELHELVGLPVELQPVQRLQRERRVAHPAVAVVPVALAARRLGQARGERRHRRSGGHVRQALDHERRALDRRAPAMVREPRRVHPRPPEQRRRGQLLARGLDVRGPGQVTRPRQRAEHLLAGAHHAARPRAAALDAQRQVRAEPRSAVPRPPRPRRGVRRPRASTRPASRP